MSQRYRQLAGRLERVRLIRSRAQELGADCETAFALEALACDEEIRALNDFNCTGPLQFSGNGTR